jgi:EAL domain-containing protein (putative c-di-GMP-specific phosphodiesterase class I)
MTEPAKRPAAPAAQKSDSGHGEQAAVSGRPALCFIVDEEQSIRHFLSLILHGAGLDTEEFSDGASMREALGRSTPELIFLNVGLDSSETVETVTELGKRGYFGFVQLMSNRGAAVLEHVKTAGVQHGLQMLPVLKKPFETSAILVTMHDLKLGYPAPVAARIHLSEVLNSGWLEFWYQPRIDLRRKRLAGVEAFARARHPKLGVLSPSAFMPGAMEADLLKFSELSLVNALDASTRLAAIGVNLVFSVDIPVPALVKMAIPDIIAAHRPKNDQWPGLVIDVNEEQIVHDLPLASDLSKKVGRDVKLALDEFGDGYALLARHKILPFTELKLAPSFVNDCATDKVNAPFCNTAIRFAHDLGCTVVGLGIEKASDALALTRMGCDFGQGFLLGQPMPEDRFMSLLRQRAGAQARPAAAAG